jgi:LysR family transcriptional regulator, glycine cleavage system transcriptional activator
VIACVPLLVAVAEAGSFVGAAGRLDLDPSAVSHRVRGLEQALGLRLFDRTTRSLRPTRAGTLLCEAARRATADLARALVAAREARRDATVRLSVMSSLAMKWLVPRLPLAREAGLDLALDVSEGFADLGPGGADAAIRFGIGPYPGLHSTRLASCALQPVIGAGLEVRFGRSFDPLDRHGPPLLGDLGSGRNRALVSWDEYARRHGRPLPEGTPRQDFDRADLMLVAAISGLGVALGRSVLIDDDVAGGLLVPVGEAVRIEAAYWLVTSPEEADAERIRSLRQWLADRFAASSASPG